jgi:hypothetical protein
MTGGEGCLIEQSAPVVGAVTDKSLVAVAVVIVGSDHPRSSFLILERANVSARCL